MRTYVPKVWSRPERSAGPSSNPTPRNHYDHLHNGQYALESFGASRNKSHSNRKYGIKGLTEIGNESEEAIVKVGGTDAKDFKR